MEQILEIHFENDHNLLYHTEYKVVVGVNEGFFFGNCEGKLNFC